MRRLAALYRDRGGSPAVEFALVAPVFLMLLLGVFQMAIWMQAYNAMRNAVGETARNVSVEFQTDNKLTNGQIADVGLAVATTSPYMLKSEALDVAVSQPIVQRVAGARELQLTLTYEMPSFLDFAGFAGPEVSYSRALFVSDS